MNVPSPQALTPVFSLLLLGRWRGGFGAPLEDRENLFQRSPLLLWPGFGRIIVSGVARARGRGLRRGPRPRGRRRSGAGSPGRRGRCAKNLAEEAGNAVGDSLEHSRGTGLRPLDKDLLPRSFAGDARARRQLDRNDSRGRGEILDLLVGRNLSGALHKLGPHRERRGASREPQISIVVITHPHDREEVRGEPGEPAVVAGSGLAR